MIDTALKINIPLYNGTKGIVDQCFYSSDGELDKTHIWWIVPLQVLGVGGNPAHKVKTVPTRAEYKGIVTLEVWDKYLQAQPKLIATIKIDVDANTYEVAVTPRYACLRLVAQFNLMRSPSGPHYTQAFRNETHYGQWEFADHI